VPFIQSTIVRYSLRLIGALLLLCGGCGSRQELVEIKGQVRFEGQPINDGSIDFIPIDGTAGASAGATIRDGAYEIPAKWGTRADGFYTVRIVGYRGTGKMEAAKREGGGALYEMKENFIPPQYNTDSTLKIRISDVTDTRKMDFDLVAK
jgi:hypothetical protein